MANDLITTGGALARVSGANLPAPITNGILDLLTAFAAGPHQETADKKRLFKVYGEAVAGFEAVVIEGAIAHLKLHNPRNPFRPTPQDLFETCETLIDTWKQRIREHFLKECAGLILHKDFRAPLAAAPLEPGCPIPAALVKRYLRDVLSHYGDDGKTLEVELVGDRKRLAAIPVECFRTGQRDAVLTIITDTEKRKAEAAVHNAYLETLDPDLRHHRRIVLNTGDNHKLSEAELLDEARESMRRAAAAAEDDERERVDILKRQEVNQEPEVKALIARIHAAKDDSESVRLDAVDAYIDALTARGAKPPPHLAIARRHGGRG